jgi:hypothetical protein
MKEKKVTESLNLKEMPAKVQSSSDEKNVLSNLEAQLRCKKISTI